MTTTEQSPWVSSRVENGALVLSILIPKLDRKLHPKAEYLRHVTEAIAAGHKDVILDLSKLRYSNHVWGLFQLIFSVNNLIHPIGGRLAVCGLGGHPKRAFLFAEMDRYLPPYRDVAEAHEGLGAR